MEKSLNERVQESNQKLLDIWKEIENKITDTKSPEFKKRRKEIFAENKRLSAALAKVNKMKKTD